MCDGGHMLGARVCDYNEDADGFSLDLFIFTAVSEKDLKKSVLEEVLAIFLSLPLFHSLCGSTLSNAHTSPTSTDTPKSNYCHPAHIFIRK